MIRSSRLLVAVARQQPFGRIINATSQQLQQQQQQGRLMSTAMANQIKSGGGNDDGNGLEEPLMNKKQPFVTAKLEPGEWDVNRKDPYYRPKPPRNKLISAEDFANRPPVGFDGEFSTYEDSMIVLSWMDSRTCRQIYLLYTDMMIRTEQDYPGRTSHEYVCRALAQKFQITPWRAAGIVQLQHNEEQMRRNHPELLCEEQAQYAEEMIVRNIKDAYRAERTIPPNRGSGGSEPYQPFVEDPVGIHGLGEPDETSSTWVSADDIYDLEAKLEGANVRDDKLARILIDEHVYREDVDESTLDVKTDGTAKRLIKAATTVRTEQQQAEDGRAQMTDIPYPETNAQGIRRPRWKYVAKVVNTRSMRKKGRKITTYTNNNMENTIVEHDGTLRVATVAEAKQVAWRPTRTTSNEYIYEGVKKAWLDRTIHGKTGVWGQAPKTSAVAALASDLMMMTSEPPPPSQEDVPDETSFGASDVSKEADSDIEEEEEEEEDDDDDGDDDTMEEEFDGSDTDEDENGNTKKP